MARARRHTFYQRWTVETIVEELRRLQRSGMRMTATEVIAAGHTALASAIHHHIGSFDRARRLAKIPHPGRLMPHTTEKWDEDRVVDEIKILHREGKPLAYKMVPTKLVDAAVFYCGSWKNAIEMAGLDYATIRRSSPAWSREEIIHALRGVAKKSVRGVDEIGHPLINAARRTFGSVRAAMIAAGLKPQQLFRTRLLNDHELGVQLRRIIREQPEMSGGQLRAMPLGRVLVRRFGSLEAGLERYSIRWRPRPGRARPGTPRKRI